jgi:phosphate transport system permease protein
MRAIELVVRRRRRQDLVFQALGVAATLVGLIALAALIVDLAIDGLGWLDWQFLTSFPSRVAEKAGVLAAWVGSVLVLLVCALCAIPLGIAAGIYLEEYAPKTRLTALIEVNITNLAGVPSVIYGLMALGLMVYALHLGQSILVGGVTLAFLVLPIVIVATRESLRAIPSSMREAAYALGALRWEVIRDHLLPGASAGIATGVILALSRALGETAPLVTIGALTFIPFLPPSPVQSSPPFVSFEWLHSEFTVLPIQMFNWVNRPGSDFLSNAAAAGLLLICVTLLLNAAAIVVRYRMRKRIQW